MIVGLFLLHVYLFNSGLNERHISTSSNSSILFFRQFWLFILVVCLPPYLSISTSCTTLKSPPIIKFWSEYSWRLPNTDVKKSGPSLLGAYILHNTNSWLSILTLRMINLPFLSVNICDILKLRLFMNNIQTPPLCALLLLKKISFPHSALHPSSCSAVQWVSCKKIICGFLFLSHKNISCLLLGSRSPQTLSEIIFKLFIMIYFYAKH